MAVGLTPKHIESFSLNEHTHEQFLVIASETLKQLEWELGYISRSGLIAYTRNGIFSNNFEITIKLEEGQATIKSSSTGSEVFDMGKNKANIETFDKTFEEVKLTLTPEEIDNRYAELESMFPTEEEDLIKQIDDTKIRGIKGFLSIFKPVEGFFVTPILLNLNVLVFILMAVSGVGIMFPETEGLINWGANFRALTIGGEWWRLLTCCFIHIGIIHLIMNMYALMYIGVLLEPYLGKSRFLAAYLLTGIAASVTSITWHPNTVSAGASGAIFGMYGVFLAMLTTNVIEKNARKTLLTSIGVFVAYNLAYGMKGGIDNAAHIGGLVSGMVIGYAFIPGLKKPESVGLNYGAIAALSLLVVVSSFGVCRKLPNDIGIYMERMKTFESMEAMALEVYSLPANTPDKDILYGLKDKGMYYWNENITLIDGLEKLDLPEELRERNKLLKQYCELRLKSYELSYHAVSENSLRYKEAISTYEMQIQQKINEIQRNIDGK
jgi:rhomboid protease GluP